MDDFAEEMACVVRRLFPDDEKENVPPKEQQSLPHHHRLQTDRGKENVMHLNKRKRTSILSTLSPSPLREIRNGATFKTNNFNQTNNGHHSGTMNHFFGSTDGVFPRPDIRDDRGVPKLNSPRTQKFTILDDTKMKIEEDSPFIECERIQNVNSPNEDGYSTSAIEYMERFDNVMSQRYPEGTDFLLIRDAIIANDDVRGLAPMEVNLAELSKEELTTIRVLIVPFQRQQTMDQMGKLILGDNFGRNNISYDRVFWFSVLKSYGIFKRAYATESRDLGKRFNQIFGFTYHLSKHPHWMTHHARGWGGEKMIAGLAMRWKQLLKFSPGQMSLDKEYSYPAVLCFLEEFKTTVEDVETNGDPKLLFDYGK